MHMLVDPRPRERRAVEGAYCEALKRDPCAYCGAPYEHIDHIDPFGPDDWTNKTAACGRCNPAKGVSSLLGFLGAEASRSTSPPPLSEVAGEIVKYGKAHELYALWALAVRRTWRLV